jgi:hypothetical protein
MDDVTAHCDEIDRCNQRGGRMFSIVDLLDAETVTRELADYLLAAIRGGASFMVGARPGGAGKTTVMGALLNFVPGNVVLQPADGMGAIDAGRRAPSPRCCYICHEIGWGNYYAYLSGGTLRAYFELPEAGHMLATNLHADTLEEARDQVTRQHGVPVASFRRMHLALFLRVEGRWPARREIVTAWEGDGTSEHRLIYAGRKLDAAASRLVTPAGLQAARARLDTILASQARTIEEVRTAVLRT